MAHGTQSKPGGAFLNSLAPTALTWSDVFLRRKWNSRATSRFGCYRGRIGMITRKSRRKMTRLAKRCAELHNDAATLARRLRNKVNRSWLWSTWKWMAAVVTHQ